MPTLAAINVEGRIDIPATTYGSLGGFLQDQRGSIWGVTCGHVAQNIGASVTFEDVSHTRYPNAATARHTSFPFPAHPQSILCNPYGNTQAVHVDTDAALSEVVPAFSPPRQWNPSA